MTDPSSREYFMLTYAPLIEAVENGWLFASGNLSRDPVIAQFAKDWNKSFPGVEVPYLDGLFDIRVIRIPKGKRFHISEHDGSERVILESDEQWY